MSESAALLVGEVLPREPMRQWVLSVPYPLRFLFAIRPAIQTQALGIAYRAIAAHQIRKAGLTRKTARTGAVTLIQRFGSALNLNVHFHMLFLDGVYLGPDAGSPPRFLPARTPTPGELARLTHTIARRIGRFLEREGLLEAAAAEGSSYLAPQTSGEGPMDRLLGHSITYRIALGPHRGRKVCTLQTLPPAQAPGPFREIVASLAGFSLHAGVVARAHERQRLERLARYIARPAVCERRLSLTPQGNVRYALKTPYRDGTTHVVFEPLDFIARLAALVPPPRGRLTRYHGLSSPPTVSTVLW